MVLLKGIFSRDCRKYRFQRAFSNGQIAVGQAFQPVFRLGFRIERDPPCGRLARIERVSARESGAEAHALQTLCAVRGWLAGAKRLECVRFSAAFRVKSRRSLCCCSPRDNPRGKKTKLRGAGCDFFLSSLILGEKMYLQNKSVDRNSLRSSNVQLLLH